MIESLRQLLLDPRAPRYIGRHRAPSSLPVFNLGLRQPRTTSVA